MRLRLARHRSGIDLMLGPDLLAHDRTNHPALTVYHQFDDAAAERLAGV
jgi:hypothetical protein